MDKALCVVGGLLGGWILFRPRVGFVRDVSSTDSTSNVQASQTKPSVPPIKLDTDFARNIDELQKRCVMTKKIQYNQAEALGYVTPVLALATALSGFVLSLPKESSPVFIGSTWVRGTATLLVVGLPALLGAIRSDLVSSHKVAGARYDYLERRARLLKMEVDAKQKDEAEALKELQTLWADKTKLDEEAPIATEFLPFGKSYVKRQLDEQKARKGTYVDP